LFELLQVSGEGFGDAVVAGAGWRNHLGPARASGCCDELGAELHIMVDTACARRTKEHLSLAYISSLI